MPTANPWQDPTFAAHYAEEASDPERGWYEHEVNFPSLLELVPEATNRILDFGSGPGDFTAMLAEYFEQVEGCDNSEAMVAIAQKAYPQVPFFAWDFHDDLPVGHESYDLVISKLTVQFIEDIEVFATKMRDTLTSKGSLIISVPHPVHAAKQVDDYWQETGYRQQIGKYGIYDTMIHRSLERYVDVFLSNGFVLTGLAEPKAERAILKKHGANPEDFTLPKRLNMRFEKALEKSQ